MPLAFESDKVLFEIYREPTYSGRYRVVYFTELNDHNREQEFNHALGGEHFYDGFIRNYGKDEAKQVIERLLQRLNEGERLDRLEVETVLKPYMP
jgi:thiaminase